MKKRLIIGGLLLAGLAAACTLAPRETGRGFMFALPSVKTAPHVPLGDTLVVALPTTSPQLDTYRIALIRNTGRWDYYARARWVDFLPLLVQDSLTKTLSDAKLFKATATDRAGLTGDLILQTEIESFQAEYAQGSQAPMVRVRMIVRLLSRSQRTLIVSFDIRAEQKAAGDRLSDIQAAFAGAYQAAQKKLVTDLRQKPK